MVEGGNKYKSARITEEERLTFRKLSFFVQTRSLICYRKSAFPSKHFNIDHSQLAGCMCHRKNKGITMKINANQEQKLGIDIKAFNIINCTLSYHFVEIDIYKYIIIFITDTS